MRVNGFPRIVLVLLTAASGLPCPTAAGSDPARPCPPARTLGELGRRLALDHPGDGTRPLVISNDNLAELAAGGSLTTAGAATTNAPEAPAEQAGHSATPGQAALRERWRQRVRAQSERVATLEEQVRRLAAEVEALEDLYRSTTGNPRREGAVKQRLDRALERHAAAAARLGRERTEHDRLIRQARFDGAEPGWFR